MFDQEELLAEFEQLKAQDTDRLVYGSDRHNYRLNEPASESAVSELEQQFGVQLPLEYRNFLTRIADGGAGPYYGFHSLADSQKWTFETDLEYELPPVASRPFVPPKSLAESEQLDFPPDGILNVSGDGYIEEFLVISGPEKGSMWLHDGQHFYPHTKSTPEFPRDASHDERQAKILAHIEASFLTYDRMSFTTWYRDWISTSRMELSTGRLEWLRRRRKIDQARANRKWWWPFD